MNSSFISDNNFCCERAMKLEMCQKSCTSQEIFQPKFSQRNAFACDRVEGTGIKPTHHFKNM